MDQTITVSFGYGVNIYDPALFQPSGASSPAANTPGSAGTTTSLVQSVATERLRKICDEVSKAHKCQVMCTIAAQNPVVFIENQANGSSGQSSGMPNVIGTQGGAATSSTSTANKSGVQEGGYHEVNFSITLHGTVSQVMQARGAILRQNPTQTAITVKANRRLLLNSNDEMKPSVRNRVNDIMEKTKTQITILGQNDFNEPGKPRPPPGLVGAAENSVNIEISGPRDAVEKARLMTLVSLDEIGGLRIQAIDIDPKLHWVIAGRKRSQLNSIMQDTNTNIYLPSPFITQNWKPKEEGMSATLPDFMKIYVTGDAEGIGKASAKLQEIATEKKNKLLIRSITCLPRKIDWMWTNRRDVLKKVMNDNGVFIALPPVGNQSNLISVYGEDPVYVERAVRAIMLTACEFYVSCVQLATNILAPNGQTALTAAHVTHMFPVLGDVVQSSKAEVVFKTAFIEIYGLESGVKSAYRQLTELDNVKAFIRDTKFQVELALEHRDFIQGKKNGKINKIIRASGCKITFHEKYNEYNMLIDIVSPFPVKALEGLTLLEDELPGELSFFVPDTFHKRIIGVGGKNIQRIMKKHGVFVKFSGNEELATFGGYFENEDNVIARTPMKNAAELEPFKQAVFELLETPIGLDSQVSVTIPREYHRMVAGPHGRHVLELENATSVKVIFPDKEAGSDDVILKGSESQVQRARNMILELVPEVYEITVPASDKVARAISGEDWEQLLKHLKETNVQVLAFKPNTDKNGTFESDFSFMCYHWRANSKLDKTRDMIVNYLQSKEIIAQSPPLPKSTSVANLKASKSFDSFQAFSSKLFAPNAVSSPAKSPPSSAPDSSAFEAFKQARNVGSSSNLRQTLGEEDKTDKPRSTSPDRSSHYSGRRRSSAASHTSAFSNDLHNNDDASYRSERTGRQPSDRFSGMMMSASMPNGRSFRARASSIHDEIAESTTGVLTNLQMEEVLGKSPSEQLKHLLTLLALQKYTQVFEEQEVDFSTLLTMTDADLKEIGVSAFGARKKLTNAVTDLKGYKVRGLSFPGVTAALGYKRFSVDDRKEPDNRILRVEGNEPR